MNNTKQRIPPDRYTKEELGHFGQIYRNAKFYCERSKYDELYNSGKLLKTCKYVEKAAWEMIDNLENEYIGMPYYRRYEYAEDWAGNYKLRKYKASVINELYNVLIHCINIKYAKISDHTF